MICYHFLIGILAFKFEDIGFFLHVQSSLIDFSKGTLFPLALLPPGLLTVVNYLPFPHTVYTPASLLCGQISLNEAWHALGVLLLWTLALILTCCLSYRHLRVRFDGVGI